MVIRTFHLIAMASILISGAAAQAATGAGRLDNLLDNSLREKMALTRLKQHVPVSKMGQTTLAGAIGIVEEGTGFVIHVDWKALEAAGLKKDEVVEIDGHLVPYGDYLQSVVAYAGVELVLYFKEPAGEFWLTTRWACPVRVVAPGKPAPADIWGGTEADAIMREKLEAVLGKCEFKEVGFEKVMDSLQNTGEFKMFVNWQALAAAGIDKNTPVSLNVSQVPARKILTTVLSEVGGGAAQLGYTISDGLLVVSTKDDLNSAKYQEVRVFDIRHLLASKAPGSEEYDERVKGIIDAIKTTIAPESWRDAGGTIGSLRELNGQLIVNQVRDNQVAILNLLKNMETWTFRKRAGLLVN